MELHLNRYRCGFELGFTYVGLLIFLAVIGLAATYSLEAGKIFSEKPREEELLHIGAQYQQAFDNYALATPLGQSAYPKSLDDLLLDKRGKVPQRHLRKVFLDPITGLAMELELLNDGSIIGVHSISKAKPIKQTGFSIEFALLEGRDHYDQWVFSRTPKSNAVR